MHFELRKAATTTFSILSKNTLAQKSPTLWLGRSHVALPCSLEEEPDDKHLKACHCNHDQTLQYAEVKDALLCASYGGEVSVLSDAEVFLVSVDGR